MKRLEFTSLIDASQERVWAAITDHEGMSTWSPVKKVMLDPVGSPDRNGLGAKRHMSGVGPTVVEEVTEWSPPDQYVYVLRSGAPIRDHRGVVQLTEEDGATRVRWTIQFRPTVPGTGWLIVALLRNVVGGMLKRLKSQLES